MNTYVYEGPVMEFNRCVLSNWSATTAAKSEKKARYKIKGINTMNEEQLLKRKIIDWQALRYPFQGN